MRILSLCKAAEQDSEQENGYYLCESKMYMNVNVLQDCQNLLVSKKGFSTIIGETVTEV